MEEEDLEKLKWLVDLSPEEVKRLKKLLEEQPQIHKFIEKERAYSIVLAGIKQVSVWILAVSAATVLGWDKIKAFIGLAK